MRSIRYGVIAVVLVIMGLNKILFAPGVRTDGTVSFSKAKDMTVSGAPD